MGRVVPVVPEPDDGADQVAELEKRHAALRQAAGLPAADVGALLEAAFTELEGAIGLLAGPWTKHGQVTGGRSTDQEGAERRVLRAAFADAPVPLFLLAGDGTVQRVNKAAAELLGSKPGYATGRSFTTFVALQSRAAVQTQLNAVARSSRVGRVRCGLLSSTGATLAELTISLVSVSGDRDRLIVAVADVARTAGEDEDSTIARPTDASISGNGAAEAGGKRSAGAVEAITQRMDLVTAVTRLLLENENFSESMTLQRSARLLAGELAAWVVVDIDRRGQLRRQFVIGPEGPGLAGISDSAAALNPMPGSLPHTVHESGKAVLIAHADDAEVLGPGPGDIPLLMVLGSTSVLSVPITDRESRYGVLTLARQAGHSHFEIADLGLVEELGEQLALAIRVDHMFRRRTEIADALQASLLPRRLPEIAGVELAAAGPAPRLRARLARADVAQGRHAVPIHRWPHSGAGTGPDLFPGPADRRTGRPGRNSSRSVRGRHAPEVARIHRGYPRRRHHHDGAAGRRQPGAPGTRQATLSPSWIGGPALSKCGDRWQGPLALIVMPAAMAEA